MALGFLLLYLIKKCFIYSLGVVILIDDFPTDGLHSKVILSPSSLNL